MKRSPYAFLTGSLAYSVETKHPLFALAELYYTPAIEGCAKKYHANRPRRQYNILMSKCLWGILWCNIQYDNVSRSPPIVV